MKMRLLACTLLLAACGQGGPLSVFSGGWQLHETRDELTGTTSQTASRIIQIESGTVELSATCRGVQRVASFQPTDAGSFAGTLGGAAAADVLQAYQLLAAFEGASLAEAMEFRFTFLGSSSTQTFALADMPGDAGDGHPLLLRASSREGEAGSVIGLASHRNSLTLLVPARDFNGGNAPSAFRVEVPLLLNQANGAPPLSQNVVVDLTPQDDALQQLIASCDSSEAASSVPASTAEASERNASEVQATLPEQPLERMEIDAEAHASLSALIRHYLDELARNSFPHMQSIGSDQIAMLDPGSDHQWSMPLLAQTGYVFLGVCDNECDDIDMELIEQSSGRVVASDSSSSDMPILQFTPANDGQFTVRTLLQNCTVAPCFVGSRVLVDK